MKRITVKNLGRHLSEVVSEAESGERFVITRHKVPVAELGSTGFALW